MSPVRDDLLASGALVVEEQGGFRVTPPSIASLARAVAIARGHHLHLRLRGGNDAPVSPAAGGVVLELSSLDRVSAVDGVTGIVRVEAGCSVAALEAAARRAGSTLGPLLPSVRAGSVGAWLAGPTRGERGIPGSRRETAALSVAAVLADGRIAESRAAPRSATGPDLDHLALGGGGRLCVVATAWIRLFPSSPALSSTWTCADLRTAVEAVRRLCQDRVAPVRARIIALGDSARLGISWEGIETAPIDRDRAARLLPSVGCAPEPDPDATWWVRDQPGGHAVEVGACWPALSSWSPRGEMLLLGLHAGGAFAAVSLPEGRPADECASLARAAGARVVAPRFLRDAGPGWSAMGAGAAWQRLVEALGAGEAA